jgi:transcriptional regulator with XRE-family HTH domain
MNEDKHPDAVEGLGRFLRSRRELLSPTAAGLPSTGPRRVPGLRRDEVAALAGVSTGYYVRLEQGREHNPSRRVLEAVAQVLRLSDEDRLHLLRMARPPARRGRPPRRVERAGGHLRRLIDGWAGTPAFIIGRAQDILATNDLATALHCDFTQSDNVLRMLFLDPAAKEVYRNPERAMLRAVADLRQTATQTPDDPRIVELVGELAVRSGDFRSLWAREHSRVPPYEVTRMRHSAVGDLELRHEAFHVRSAPGQQLIVLQADPASPSADALALLGSLSAPSPAREEQDSAADG